MPNQPSCLAIWMSKMKLVRFCSKWSQNVRLVKAFSKITVRHYTYAMNYGNKAPKFILRAYNHERANL